MVVPTFLELICKIGVCGSSHILKLICKIAVRGSSHIFRMDL
ncbi:hypothetical protein LEP1GSC116_4196 [Leptospira interrogans serovar Icterohaemorrhagiae str. Verdun HP]|uniref:Uncharacterized protein n=1 Tax=Leptospira interrogans serovar Icterohaemorrhagiae str. Verdun HP TaxID=1049910 RepID=M6RHA7_LEPIR|nr:hypothetical protein LEP1GSC116_4196 [Leptospira interrogans serovar Icterohaemorrhagiae str. Verdun HP]